MDKLFTKEHEWIVVEDGIASVGITDYAQKKLGEIVYVELPEEGDEIEAGDSVASLESVKAASDIYAPISGEITEVNEELEDEPGLVNSDAETTWIVKMTVADEAELDGLMDEKAYLEFIEG